MSDLTERKKGGATDYGSEGSASLASSSDGGSEDSGSKAESNETTGSIEEVDDSEEESLGSEEDPISSEDSKEAEEEESSEEEDSSSEEESGEDSFIDDSAASSADSSDKGKKKRARKHSRRTKMKKASESSVEGKPSASVVSPDSKTSASKVKKSPKGKEAKRAKAKAGGKDAKNAKKDVMKEKGSKGKESGNHNKGKLGKASKKHKSKELGVAKAASNTDESSKSALELGLERYLDKQSGNKFVKDVGFIVFVALKKLVVFLDVVLKQSEGVYQNWMFKPTLIVPVYESTMGRIDLGVMLDLTVRAKPFDAEDRARISNTRKDIPDRVLVMVMDFSPEFQLSKKKEKVEAAVKKLVTLMADEKFGGCLITACRTMWGGAGKFAEHLALSYDKEMQPVLRGNNTRLKELQSLDETFTNHAIGKLLEQLYSPGTNGEEVRTLQDIPYKSIKKAERKLWFKEGEVPQGIRDMFG